MTTLPRKPSNNQLANKCQECGCCCDSCVNSNSIYLHQEIESLKERLAERDQQVVSMESQILMHAKQYPNGEMQALRDNLYFWQDKYERLLESYRKLQKVNQGLEDKLLRIADKFENEKKILTNNVTDLTNDVNQAQASIVLLEQQNVRYRQDCTLALSLLQQSHSLQMPKNFEELDHKEPHANSKNVNGVEDGKMARVVIPTFPPTAIVYALNGDDKSDSPPETTKHLSSHVSPSVVAKILQERMQTNQCANCCNQQLNHSNLYAHPNANHDLAIQMDQTLTSSATNFPHQVYSSQYDKNPKVTRLKGDTMIV